MAVEEGMTRQLSRLAATEKAGVPWPAEGRKRPSAAEVVALLEWGKPVAHDQRWSCATGCRIPPSEPETMASMMAPGDSHR